MQRFTPRGSFSTNQVLDDLRDVATGDAVEGDVLIRGETGWESGAVEEIPVGAIMMWPTASAPSGWLLLDGTLQSRTTYAALFALLGTTYGSGDGSTTFGLPDLRGRAPIGAGTGSGLTARTLADTVGTETHTLTAAESGLPSHSHGIVRGSGGLPNTSGGFVAFADNNAGTSGNTNSVSGADAASDHNNMQPSLILNFIIKV